MELLYCWCGNAENWKIENLGLNFGGKFVFSYDSGVLTCRNNPDYIDNFFSDSGAVTNITALVGRNGAGKTSTLKAILKSAFNARNFNPSVNKVDANIFDESYIASFYIEGDIYVFFSDDLQSVQVEKGEIDTVFHTHSVSWTGCDDENPLHGISAFYYSSIPFRGDQTANKSSRWKRNVNALSLSPDPDETKQFVARLEMLSARRDLREHVENDRFPLPEFCEVDFGGYDLNRFETILTEAQSDLSVKVEFYKAVDLLTPLRLNQNYRFDNNEFSEWWRTGFNALIHSVYANYLLSIHTTATDHNISTQMVKAINILPRQNTLDENVDAVLHAMQGNFGDYKEANDSKLSAIIELISYLRKLHHGLVREDRLAEIYDEKFRVFSFPIDDSPWSIFKFLKKYNAAFNGTGLQLGLRHLSHGEYAFLDLLTALHQAEEASASATSHKDRGVILFLDEADVFFHPQWEKQYISLLLEFSEALFERRKVQIILTTNKPVILSDLPKNNVVFLENDNEEKISVSQGKREETFAQNIHTLYSNSFFLQDGLLGEFAKTKILALIDRIKSGRTEKEFLQYEILVSKIGEHVLRKRLEEVLSKRRLEVLGASSEIASLERRISALREQEMGQLGD